MRWSAILAASAAFVALVGVASPTWAQVAPALGVSARFGALGNSGVTGATGTGVVVSGDVGSSPTASISNFPPSTAPGFVIHTTNDPTVQQAHTDAVAAYNALAAQGAGTVLGANLTGVTLTPGVYSFAAAADLPVGTTLTFNGAGIYVINVTSSLTMNATSNVTLTNGASACDIYWRVGTSATLNGSTFRGTVIADASITVGAGANVTGRVLAGTGATGAVTMSGAGGNTIGGCSTAAARPTIAKVFNPTSVTAGGGSRLTVTGSNSTSTASILTAALTDTLPAGVRLAATPDPVTTCGGTVTATAGAGSFTLALAGSTIPAAGSCTVAVNVTAANVGTFVNTIPAGALQTSTGTNAAAATATLTATCATITVGPPNLLPGRVGIEYRQQITASGGTGAYTFTVSSGTLPAGLTLATDGLLSGTPTTLGSTTVTLQATDGNGCPGTIVYTVVVAAATCPVIAVGPPTLPPGNVDVAYSHQITASGGTGGHTFTVASGALPPGLTLSTSGLLSGTPTTLGTSAVTIQAADGDGCPGVIAYAIVIAATTCPVITVGPATLPVATVGVASSLQLTASGGTGPYAFSVLSGALPAGVTLSSTGLLSGTPTTLGSTLVNIQVTDANGCPGVIAYTITIATAVPTLPQVFVILLALGLMAIGYVRLRRPARAN